MFAPFVSETTFILKELTFSKHVFPPSPTGRCGQNKTLKDFLYIYFFNALSLIWVCCCFDQIQKPDFLSFCFLFWISHTCWTEPVLGRLAPLKVSVFRGVAYVTCDKCVAVNVQILNLSVLYLIHSFLLITHVHSSLMICCASDVQRRSKKVYRNTHT